MCGDEWKSDVLFGGAGDIGSVMMNGSKDTRAGFMIAVDARGSGYPKVYEVEMKKALS